MDFDPYQSHWRERVPPMTLLETCWQMKSPRGRGDVRRVQNDCRARGEVLVSERRSDSFTVRRRNRNGASDCRRVENSGRTKRVCIATELIKRIG